MPSAMVPATGRVARPLGEQPSSVTDNGAPDAARLFLGFHGPHGADHRCRRTYEGSVPSDPRDIDGSGGVRGPDRWGASELTGWFREPASALDHE